MTKYQLHVLLSIINTQPEWEIARGAHVGRAAQRLQFGNSFFYHFSTFYAIKITEKYPKMCPLFRCHQLSVNYSKIPFHEWQQSPPDMEKFEWDVADTRLLINSEGCGNVKPIDTLNRSLHTITPRLFISLINFKLFIYRLSTPRKLYRICKEIWVGIE